MAWNAFTGVCAIAALDVVLRVALNRGGLYKWWVRLLEGAMYAGMWLALIVAVRLAGGWLFGGGVKFALWALILFFGGDSVAVLIRLVRRAMRMSNDGIWAE
ncbi:MAG TPA: hypothetical protein VFL91_19600 [Thermomicrobiales bacterium]|nr:hypothetical protein [Thermomicrobiales bacterium]